MESTESVCTHPYLHVKLNHVNSHCRGRTPAPPKPVTPVVVRMNVGQCLYQYHTYLSTASAETLSGLYKDVGLFNATVPACLPGGRVP